MNMTAKSLKELFSSFAKLKVLIVGDVMIDAYIHGNVERISPEAPVPVLLINKQEMRPGGAANVAMNIRSMGATPLLVSLIGHDAEGQRLKDLLDEQQIAATYLVSDPGRATTTKTRILARGHQMMRLDHENSSDISEELEDLIIQRVTDVLDEEIPDILIFQDYNKGLLTEKVIRTVTMMCLTRNIPIAVDPKKKNFFAYQLCTLFKPNLRETKESLKTEVDPNNIDSLKAAASMLHDQLHHGITLITLSDKGIFLRTNRETFSEPAHIRDVADVSGAGDTVISVAALCLAAKTPLETLATLSNLAGGIVCEYPGVVSIEPARLLAEATKLIK